MTVLEQEIFNQINGALLSNEDKAKIAAKIAREWIKKAVEECSETYMDGFLQDFFMEYDKYLILPEAHK